MSQLQTSKLKMNDSNLHKKYFGNNQQTPYMLKVKTGFPHFVFNLHRETPEKKTFRSQGTPANKLYLQLMGQYRK